MVKEITTELKDLICEPYTEQPIRVSENKVTLPSNSEILFLMEEETKMMKI